MCIECTSALASLYGELATGGESVALAAAAFTLSTILRRPHIEGQVLRDAKGMLAKLLDGRFGSGCRHVWVPRSWHHPNPWAEYICAHCKAVVKLVRLEDQSYFP